jgi:hypothetical protein
LPGYKCTHAPQTRKHRKLTKLAKVFGSEPDVKELPLTVAEEGRAKAAAFQVRL